MTLHLPPLFPGAHIDIILWAQLRMVCAPDCGPGCLAQVSAPPHPSCVTLRQALNLSLSLGLLHCKMKMLLGSTSWMRIKHL